MRSAIATAFLFSLSSSPSAAVGNHKCSANNCGGCLADSDCYWWADIGYCEEGCGMHGCGASVCASDIHSCYDCLGGEGTEAARQYSWSPDADACLDNCSEIADASCYSSSRYDESICESISVCRTHHTCTECLSGGSCAWSEGSCYDSCDEYDVPQDGSCFEGERYHPSDVCTDGPSERECVTDDRPRPTRNGQRFRFNLMKSDAKCVDSQDRLYEWGQFEK